MERTPAGDPQRLGRPRLRLGQEMVLVFMPTLMVLLVLFLVERVGHQQLLFTSLASSAFLIYLDPQHGTNQASTLFWAQAIAAVAGVLSLGILGPGYFAAAVAMSAAILLMVLFNIVHPPAVGTALSFAFRSGSENTLMLFAIALAMILVLVVLERLTLRLLERMTGSTGTAGQVR